MTARLAMDDQGAVWATTDIEGGLVRFGRDGGQTVAIHFAQEMGVTLCVTADTEGAVWVGTQSQGLFRLRPRVFSTLAVGPDIEPNSVSMVAEAHDGSLWFSGPQYLWRWHGSEICLFDTYRLFPQTSPWFGVSGIGFLSANQPCAGLPVGGVFELPDTANDPSWLDPVVPRFREAGVVRAILTRRDSSVWLGTANGLYRVTGETSVERIEDLAPARIRVLFEDRRTNFWIGTESHGLIRWNDEGLQRLTTREGVPHARINALHEDERGHLWIATEGGLCVYREGQCLGFGPESNVPQEMICGIVEDDSHRLWLAHSDGISRVARGELEAWLQDRSVIPAVARFDRSDGLLSPSNSSGSGPVAVKGSDGRLWFATRGGLAVVNPAECPTNIPPPQVWIESVTADDQPISLDAPVRLPPGRGHTLEFRYTATSLRAPEKVRLRYRLEGHDPGWRESGAVREAVYAELRPGRYQFHVQARNHEGRWSVRDATFALQIAPFFWQTGLFYAGSSGALAGAIAGLVVWRVRRERRRQEAERLRSLEAERTRIARDMHDHLGARLASVALASDENETAHQRARETLRELNDLIWSVHPSNDSLPSLTDFIGNFASRFLAAAGLELNLDLPELIPPKPIASGLRHEVAAMFKEALRNVTQHAQAKRVTVRMRIEGAWLSLTIRDDGRGFDPSLGVPPSGGPDRVNAGRQARGSLGGNGLRNFHARATNLGGRCDIVSSPGSGTQIEFVVPLVAPN